MSAGDWKDLFKAACEGDLALVRYHVDAGVDLNYAHPEFFSTPLVGAIRAKQEAVALFMLPVLIAIAIGMLRLARRGAND